MRKLLCAALLSLCVVVTAEAQQKWANIKGQVVWPKDVKAPKPSKIDVKRCIRPADKGPLMDDTWVINPKNRGIKWVQVYVVMVDPKTGKADAKAQVPIHPLMKRIKEKSVVIDQPCCEFEPRVAGLREGQTLLVKNSSKTDAHNSNIVGVANPLIPAGGEFEFEGPWKVDDQHFPTSVSCSIHGWMKAYVRVFNHPYHTVTDENGNFELKRVPVGDNVRLVFWHETGWCVGDFRHGIKIPAPKAGTTDLGTVEIIPPED